MMSVIVGINGLSLETSNGVELFDGGGSQACESTEDGPFDFRNFCILNSVNKGVLGLGCMVLKLLGSVLFAKWCDLVEVHLEVVSHFLRELILGCFSGVTEMAARLHLSCQFRASEQPSPSLP